MALSSMTGFARTSFEVDGAKFSWELKSVNARGLEIRLRLPNGLDHLEADIRTRIRDGDRARQLLLHAGARGGGRAARRLSLNEEALALVRRGGAPAGRGGGHRDADRRRPPRHSRRAAATAARRSTARRRSAAMRRCLSALGTAIEALKRTRLEEGARLAAVLGEQIDRIAATGRGGGKRVG